MATPLAAGAQQLPHVPHIGVLYHPESHRCAHSFRQGLIDLGHVDGDTIALDYRPGGSFEQHIEQAQDLTRRKVALLVAANGRAALDAVEPGLVASLARPGGNITGISLPLRELTGKRLEIIKAAIPTADRIAVFIAPSTMAATMLHDHEAGARVLGITLHPVNVSDRGQFDEAFRDAVRGRALLF